ncbi:MAG TPA: glutamate-5-semialdehyde dehydrogenase [Myxococcales bacterium]|nr:glutamate-5-semialdehyde dehydrogenase [Myxococcales bacterium]
MRAEAIAAGAALAARDLAHAPTAQKDAALAGLADGIRSRRRRLLAANARDIATARKAGVRGALLDRLALDDRRVEAMAEAVEAVAALPDPVGEVVASWRRPNGLEVRQQRLPLGVILMVYEARPNVTSDAAALCLKSGNAAILRGGSEAARANAVLADLVASALENVGLPARSVQVVDDPSRELLAELLTQDRFIDLCIPRGGQGLMRFVRERARVPVVPHAEGVCHVYVDGGADVGRAVPVIVNAKAQRPGVCNAAECLLVHRTIARELLPRAGRALLEAGVELRACPTSLAILGRASVKAVAATEADYGREFLAKILAIRVVRDLEQALEHIARHGTGHTEAILTRDLASARRFTREVRASAVMVNASTRFNDGGELGLGAEIGISTGRLHAYGPMGLRELCAKKFVVEGDGHVRE